jgi:hypothetical protein
MFRTPGSSRVVDLKLIISFQCEHRCKMRQLVNKVGCTGPWIPDVDIPLCNEYETVKNLIKDYLNK